MRRGLTLLEVLVLLVLLLIIAGLFLAFLQSSRVKAYRVECSQHLKTIGEAIWHFQGTRPPHLREAKGPLPGPGHRTLPAARIAEGYATWAVQIAPYMPGTEALREWDLSRNYFDQSAVVRQAVIPQYYCPARQRETRLSVSDDVPIEGEPGAEHVAGAVGDYACASGDGDPRFPWTGPEANGAIILGEVLEKKGDLILRWKSRTDFSSLPRGLSVTILVGEKHVPLGKFGQSAVGDGSLYNGANPANFSRVGGPKFGLARAPESPFNDNFGSYHPGICQFLMADCSVRALANNVSAEVLGRMIVREE